MQQLHFGVEAGHFKGRLASVGRWLHIPPGNRQVGPTYQGWDNGGLPLQAPVLWGRVPVYGSNDRARYV